MEKLYKAFFVFIIVMSSVVKGGTFTMSLLDSIPTVLVKNFSISNQLTGKPTIIAFHKPGCPFCNKMVPIETKLYSEFKNKVQFLQVTFDLFPGVEYDELKKNYNITTFPAYFFYKNKHEINGLQSKSMDETEFRNKIVGFLNSK